MDEMLLYSDKKVKYLIIQGLKTCIKFWNHLSFVFVSTLFSSGVHILGFHYILQFQWVKK